ncbi:MAG: 3-dehydroquinate synthase [Bacteroidales bacterium]|nr:3-dehydroquinate synthase [Bacteroidales bacterium]
MTDILIEQDGTVLSKVHSGEKVADVAPYLADYKAVYIVYDEQVARYIPSISGLPNVHGTKAIRATESDKNMDTVLDICSWLLEDSADRYAMVLAVGGGITSDMVGFAASIYKRGIRFAYIPTTLLSQVDAAIGGKTGVNMESYKNMIGVINQPDFTYECPEVLETLPYREFVGGSAEMLKTFIIENNDGNYAKAVKVLSAIYGSEDRPATIKAHRQELLDLVHAAAAVKAGVVSRDQFEKGERRKLNLGHTFAHAIEKEAKYAISHGEAVAIGMVMAAELSDRLRLTDGTCAEALRKDFSACGLPVESPYAKETLASAMEKDKKAENGTMHFVLMSGVGDVIIKDMKVSEAL